MSENDLLYFNGINGATGDYELPPMRASDIASVALDQPLDEKLQQELKLRRENSGPKYGINADTRNLAETGWGVIFAGKDQQTAAIRDALKPLLDWRREQAARDDERFYREYAGGDGYRPGDTHLDWLARAPRAMGPGSVDPKKVPYYLLLVGGPEAIPYRFQYQIDVQYAVGRLCFDSLDEYAQYARTVVEIETAKKLKLPRRAVFFGAQNSDDPATQLSAVEMVAPLAAGMAAAQPDWTIQTQLGNVANKAQLGRYLGGADTPALLFTASHGMAFPNGHEYQLGKQGALLCADWPGPRDWRRPIPEDFYFSGTDIDPAARLSGLIAFFFACYGAGTPQLDDFARRATGQPDALAPRPFVAQLPQRLLGHSQGSALAVIGHVERAWGQSFMWRDAGRQLQVFQDTLDQLMDGYPVGAAFEWFNERHAELSVSLTGEIENIKDWNGARDDARLAGLWTANNDARNYVILGDPAVRLPLAATGDSPTTERPVINIASAAAPRKEVEKETRGEVVEKETRKEVEKETVVAAPPPIDPPTEVGAPAAVGDTSFAVQVQGERKGLVESLKDFTGQLAQSLKEAADDLSSLEVKTYTTSDFDAVKYDYATKQLTGQLKLRAVTRIAFDGDVQVVVPERNNAIDEPLWKVHLDMVREAQVNRAEFLRLMADLATRMIDLFK